MEPLSASKLTAMRYEFIRRDLRLTPHQRLIVMEILDHDFAIACLGGTRTGEAWPSKTRVAGLLGINPRSVRRGVRKAAELGYWEMELFKLKEGDERWKFRINYDVINGWAIESRASKVPGRGDTESLEGGTSVPPNLPNLNSINKTSEPRRLFFRCGQDAASRRPCLTTFGGTQPFWRRV